MVSRMFKPTPLGRLRLASVDDAPHILDFLNESVSKTFRITCTYEVSYLIENCILSICQLDENDILVGFLAARDYPLIPAVHPGAWENYIWSRYKAVELSARNTLFLHLLCWNTIYGRELVDNMLKSVFMHDPYVEHIAMIKSMRGYPLLVPGQTRPESSFRRVQAIERGVPGDLLPMLFVADRTEVSPRLRIRRAVEEDNDDIVPIIERHSEQLRKLYGEFYVSELISRHPESERVLLVCEHKELAVGVMCLNTQINYEALEESFELSPFGGLRHLDGEQPSSLSKDMDSTVSLLASSTNQGGRGEPVSPTSTFYESLMRAKDAKDAKSKVTWQFGQEAFADVHSETSKTILPVPKIAPQTSATQLDVLHLLEDEEDELDFDIINIDTAHLRVPEMLTYGHHKLGPAAHVMKIIDGISGRQERKGSIEANNKFRNHPRKIMSSNMTNPMKQQEPKRYSGPPNAFQLELFAMHPDYDERYGFDMLEAAYEIFSNRDYCVLCLPSNHASFPLLEHFTLVTPYSCRMRFINETLYVAHLNSVRCNLRLRRGEWYDLPALDAVLAQAPRIQVLLDLFQNSLHSQTLESFILLSQNQPIGVVIVGPLNDGTEIRTQYDLEPEPRRPGTDCTILAGVMSPALEPHARWYMREILRQSRYSTLFWLCRLVGKGGSSPGRNLMSLASHMTPVHPRFVVPNISGNKDLDKIYKDVSSPFALWVLERPLTSLPKVYVNNSIVVVGSSRTGLAFLETLLLGPTCQYLTFSNVTLVSEHGLPAVAECLKAADTCVPRNGRYTDRYLKTIPFHFYLDIMSAVMVKIDRKKKCIHLRGGGVKFYDELVLTCGQQFQHPDYLRESLDLVKEVEKGKPCDRILMDNPKYQPDRVPCVPELPENVMLINSLFSANSCLRKLMRMISEPRVDPQTSLSLYNKVIVYGDCIEAYSCIAALMELGLSADLITFVEPFPSEDTAAMRVNCFNDETVDERVQNSLEKLGILVFRQCILTGWHQHGKRIRSVDLMAPLHAIALPCFALFYYGLKALDLNAFRAINECGLVYDGGLVVGPTFETNDPFIYGAGPCVRYSRKLYAARRSHRYYCSEDIGEALAKLFLRKLDPFVMGDLDAANIPPEMIHRYSSSLLGFKSDHASLGSFSCTRLSLGGSFRRWQPVMKFESPILRSATLPGPLYYMKLRKPAKEIPMAAQLLMPHQGHTLMTDKDDNYFRLQLNVLHVVDAVTCLSIKPFSCEIMSQLYGKHEAFFDKLLTRYMRNEIDDLYAFFTKPWMSALYQETFRDLIENINEQDIGTIYELVKSKFAMYDDKSEMDRIEMYKSEMYRSEMNRSEMDRSDMDATTQPSLSRCSSTASCSEGGIWDNRQGRGTFRSMIDKYVARTSSVHTLHARMTTDIPSECGQSLKIRNQAAGYWRRIGGERIVTAHLAQYLERNSVTNPHYAPCHPDKI